MGALKPAMPTGGAGTRPIPKRHVWVRLCCAAPPRDWLGFFRFLRLEAEALEVDQALVTLEVRFN